MAHRIYAVDFGSWSINVAIAEPGLRGVTLTAVVERPVPPGDEPYEQRAGRVLGAIVRELGLEHDTAYFSVSGDQVFTHVLEFGFQNLRRPELEKAVGAELEGIVPVDLEDMVYTFEPIPSAAAAAGPGAPAVAGDDDPTNVGAQVGAAQARGRVAAAAMGMRVLTYAMRSDKAQSWIALGVAQGAEPRGLLPLAGSLAKVAARAPHGADPTAVIDLGHERSDVVVVTSGKPVFARTVARGGKNVTDAIARSWRLPFVEAERAKHADGFVASRIEPATSEAWQRVSEVVIAELAPLARDLRQTFAACRARTGATVKSVLLVGGASKLRGLPSFLSEQLGVPVTVLAGDDAAALVGPRLAGQVDAAGAATAIGAALDAAGGRPSFDLRQGALAYKVDLSFLRAKAMHLTIAAVAVMAFASISAAAELHSLRKSEKILTQRLSDETIAKFGHAETADEVIDATNATSGAGGSPLPKMSAYDIMLAINEKLPARDKIVLNVSQLEIGDERVTLKGTAKTPEEIDSLETSLKDIACLGAASRGSTQNSPDGLQFQFTFKTTCM